MLVIAAWLLLLQHQARCSTNATGSPMQHQKLKLNSKSIITGTWNDRKLYACGKIEETINALKKYRWNIIGVSEVHLIGFGKVVIKDG